MKKLDFKSWVKKYFEELTQNTWTSIYEKQEIGFSPSDLSRYSKKDLEEEYNLYLKNENDFNKYDESTNELVEDDD